MGDADDLTCAEIVELVTDYLEHALDRGDRRRFEEHLASCGGCAAYLEQMRRTVELVGSLKEDDLPSEAHAALLQAFRGWREVSPG